MMRNISINTSLVLFVTCAYRTLCLHLPEKLQVNVTICDAITQDVDDIKIWWGNYTTASGDYISKPICLSDDFEILKRYCQLNHWSLEPQCRRLQDDIIPCPQEFSYFDEKQICYIEVANQTYPPNCPYPNVISFFDYVFLIDSGLVEGPVWFPAKRIADFGVGNMVVTEPTKHYGDLVSLSYFWRNSFNKDCLIYKTPSFFEAVYCNSTYKTICAYHPLKNDRNNYCSRNVTRPCMMSSFDFSSSKCLCVQNLATTDSCTYLAELKEPYQNFIEANGTKCRIGLENRAGRFIWITSQEEITYSNWSIETNFSSKYGAIQNGIGWSLENDSNLNCVICEEDISYRRSNLDLTLDKDNKQLILTVENIEELVITEGNEYPVFCFSDTSVSKEIQRFSTSNFINFTRLDNNRAKMRYKYSRYCPGYYWCEAFQYPNFTLVRTSKVLVTDDDLYGNEYATTMVIQYDKDENPTLLTYFNSLFVDINDELLKWYTNVPFYLRWMTILEIDEDRRTVEYLIHVTAKSCAPVEVEYEEFRDALSKATEEVPSVLRLTEFLSVQSCMPSTTNYDSTVLHWPMTSINSTVAPYELCLQEDGSPVTRTCYGDFLYGAKWSAVNGSCSDNPVTSHATEKLYNLLNANATLEIVLNILSAITEFTTTFLPVDIYFISQILHRVNKTYVSDLNSVTRTVNNILNIPKQVLKTSQTVLNSTDRILYNFDLFIENFYMERYLRSNSVTEIETDNLVVFIFDARHTDIRGLGLFNRNGKKEVVTLEVGVSSQSLLESEDLEVATYIPEELLQQINDSMPEEEPLMVAISVFSNDHLFNEKENDPRNSNSKILGILLPKIDEEYSTLIPVVFKPSRNDFDRGCAFWNYGSTGGWGNIKGRWEVEREPHVQNDTKLEFCEFAHTTHFALLLLGDLTDQEQEKLSENQTGLHIITTVGCSLSIFGILIILLTFLLFKRWRESKGNQILVQFGLVTVLQICLLYTASSLGNQIERGWCVLVGALLHFAVLSQFCWMLVMAILQYRRFVLVFSKPFKFMLLKASLVGYAIPSIIVTIHVSVFNENYVMGRTGMCYPTGEGLIFGVLVPGGCIIGSNLIIFCMIIWNIFYRKLDSDYGRDYVLTLRLRLVFVLFFLLGITWIFGFLSEFLHDIGFIYLFSLTASVQGFIMFLAFIVFNDNTRKMYIGLIKVLKRKMEC